MIDPFIKTVEIAREVRPDESPFLIVKTTWGAVDRPDGIGIALPDTQRGAALAERLKRAILAGVVFPHPEIGVDVAGKTYAKSGYAVRGRALNADLRALGF